MNKPYAIRSDASDFLLPTDCQTFTDSSYYGYPIYDLDHAKESHEILGFGASFTDAACYMIDKIPEEQKSVLLDDLFSPEKLNLSIGRLNVGSSDYATDVYSYDDTPDDFGMAHFSIAHDEAYMIPLLRRVQGMRPDMFYFSSPWSPPGWMKTSGSMCGGYMRAKYLTAFADYYTAYLKAYRDAGIRIQAATMQNESETEQGGTMPASILHPDFEAELVGRLMPERLKAAGLDTKLWIHDHNYKGWKRVLSVLSDPEARKHTDSVAFHPYTGDPSMVRMVREQYPEVHFQMTEKGPNLRKNSAESSIFFWLDSICGALNAGCSSYVGWNYALNEIGMPNAGPFDCAGLVEINSRTGEISKSSQYRAFAHFAPYLTRGTKVLDCPVISGNPIPQFHSVVCRKKDGQYVAVLGNARGENQSIQFKLNNQYLRILVRKETVLTVCF